MSLQIEIAPPPAWGAIAAAHLDRVLEARPDARIGFPTGHTPLPLYAELRRRAPLLPWNGARLRAVMLDEYLDAEVRFRSCTWLSQEVFDPLRIDAGRVLRMPASSRSLAAECQRFEDQLRETGGCDLQLLGLGANGHIGFNEPGSAVASRTRGVILTASTAQANAAYWQGAFTPQRAATMGISTILAAGEIGLLVRGAEKAGILRQMLIESVSTACPASLLRMRPEGVWVLADAEATAGLDPRRLCALGYNVTWM